MKKLLISLILISILVLTGCSNNKVPQANTSSPAECSSDNDCVKAGCSGIICQKKTNEELFTTCQWQDYYKCYQEQTCSCIKGKCSWQNEDKINKCVKDNIAEML